MTASAALVASAIPEITDHFLTHGGSIEMKFGKPSLTRPATAVPGTLLPLMIGLMALALAAALIWLTLIMPSNQRYRADIA